MEESMDVLINLLRGDRTLVPGCGNGRDSRHTASQNVDALSFDQSRGMLEIARKRNTEGEYVLLDMSRINEINDESHGI
jgi:SAM-dependent methyltransferase